MIVGKQKKIKKEITEESVRKVFKHSAVKRIKVEGFKRNIGFLQ